MVEHSYDMLKYRVWSFGDNTFGQLGRPTSGSLAVLSSLDSDSSLQISCGSRHSACLTKAGVVYLWGYGPNNCLVKAIDNVMLTLAAAPLGMRNKEERPDGKEASLGVSNCESSNDKVTHPTKVTSLHTNYVEHVVLGEDCTLIVLGDKIGSLMSPAIESGHIERY